MNFEKLRELITATLLGLFERLKVERIQIRTLPGETPMTTERIQNRTADCDYELIWAPVAIQKRYRRADFADAVAFVADEVDKVAAELSHSPKVEIDRGDVTITLGIPIPALLSEADFDVADAIEAVVSIADAIEEVVSTPEPEPDSDPGVKND